MNCRDRERVGLSRGRSGPRRPGGTAGVGPRRSCPVPSTIRSRPPAHGLIGMLTANDITTFADKAYQGTVRTRSSATPHAAAVTRSEGGHRGTTAMRKSRPLPVGLRLRSTGTIAVAHSANTAILMTISTAIFVWSSCANGLAGARRTRGAVDHSTCRTPRVRGNPVVLHASEPPTVTSRSRCRNDRQGGTDRIYTDSEPFRLNTPGNPLVDSLCALFWR